MNTIDYWLWLIVRIKNSCHWAHYQKCTFTSVFYLYSSHITEQCRLLYCLPFTKTNCVVSIITLWSLLSRYHTREIGMAWRFFLYVWAMMAYMKYELCILIFQFTSVPTSSRAARRCVVSKWKCAQNVTVCCDGEDGNLWWNGQQQWGRTDSSPQPRVDDLLPTYFTSPRPSAWRLLPKTFAPTIPLSDFRLSKNRPWEAEGESEREPKYMQTPNIT